MVSIEYGMNDACVAMPTRYLADVAAFLDKIRGSRAQAIWISPSPIDSDDANWAIRSRIMGDYTRQMQDGGIAGVLAIDQFTPMTALWSANRPSGHLSALLTLAKVILTRQPDLEGREHLQRFIQEQRTGPDAPIGISIIWKDGADATLGNLYQCALLAWQARPEVAGRAHLRPFLDLWEDRTRPAAKDMLVDPIHPNPVGHMLMAASILTSMGARDW